MTEFLTHFFNTVQVIAVVFAIALGTFFIGCICSGIGIALEKRFGAAAFWAWVGFLIFVAGPAILAFVVTVAN